MRGFQGRHLSEEPLEIVKKAAKLLKADSKVLDLAVGEGRHALYLAEKGHLVTGVDVSDESFEKIKQKASGEIKLIKKDAREFESEEKYDLVVCTGLLHFFEDNEVEMIIEKMKQLTKPGGYNVLAARMDQNPRGSLSHLFSHQEMKGYYTNWEIIEYEEVEKEDYPARKVQIVLSEKTE